MNTTVVDSYANIYHNQTFTGPKTFYANYLINLRSDNDNIYLQPLNGVASTLGFVPMCFLKLVQA